MKAKNFSDVDRSDLDRQVQDAHEQLFRLRFQMGMGQMEGLKKYRILKKDRARMLTALNQNKTAETAAPSATKAAAAEKKSRKK